MIAVNRAYELAPWSDALYGCDGRFWRTYPEALRFPGLKVTQDEGAAHEFPVLRRVALVSGAEISMTPGVIGSGGNGGFQALNLAMQWGSARIVLLGFDMCIANGTHFHGDHIGRCHNPRADTVMNWRAHFDRAVPAIRDAGVEVLNATRGGALEAFPRVTLEQAI